MRRKRDSEFDVVTDCLGYIDGIKRAQTDALQAAYRASNYSITELSRRCNIAYNTIHNWIRGTSTPTPETFERAMRNFIKST